MSCSEFVLFFFVLNFVLSFVFQILDFVFFIRRCGVFCFVVVFLFFFSFYHDRTFFLLRNLQCWRCGFIVLFFVFYIFALVGCCFFLVICCCIWRVLDIFFWVGSPICCAILCVFLKLWCFFLCFVVVFSGAQHHAGKHTIKTPFPRWEGTKKNTSHRRLRRSSGPGASMSLCHKHSAKGLHDHRMSESQLVGKLKQMETWK